MSTPPPEPAFDDDEEAATLGTERDAEVSELAATTEAAPDSALQDDDRLPAGDTDATT